MPTTLSTPLASQRAVERVHRGCERRWIAEQRCDVEERDPRRGEVGDRSQVLAQPARTFARCGQRRFPFLRGRGGMARPDSSGTGLLALGADAARGDDLRLVHRDRLLDGPLACLDPAPQVAVALLALLEHGEQRAGDEDRRVGARGQTDQQRQRELLQRGRAEHQRPHDQQRCDRQEGGDRGVQGTHEHLVEGEVHHGRVGEARGGADQARVLVHLVEDDDAVVDGETQDREQRDHRGGSHLEAGQRVDADGHEHVVHESDHAWARPSSTRTAG